MTEAELFRAVAALDAAPTKRIGYPTFERESLLRENAALRKALHEARHLIMATTGVNEKAPCIRRIDAVLGNASAHQECEDTLAVLAAIGNARTPLTNDELAERMGCSKAESSKRVTNAVLAGRVTRTRGGRTVEIAPAHTNGGWKE